MQLRHVQDKLPAIREQGVRELLFVSTPATSASERIAIDELQSREFVTGQNIYAAPFDTFSESCLILFGESGRREFLIQVGNSLDDANADLAHRQTWRDLLGKL